MAGPLTRQAQNEATVRFGPQRFALRELLATLMENRNTALHQADAYNRAMQSVLTKARGETEKNYGAAMQAGSGTSEMVRNALEGLGSAAAPFQAALAREGGLGTERLNASRTASLQDLTNRRLEAASGSQYQRQAAQSEYSSGLGKIQRSYLELANEQGAFTQGRIGELKKEQADRQFQRDLAEMRDATSRRGQSLSHQDRVRGQNLSHQDRQAAARNKRANGPRHIGGGGPKLASQEQHTSLWERYQGALPDAKDLRKHGSSYKETVDALANGVAGQTLTDPKTGQKLKDPGVKGRGRLAALVAADYAYYGGLTDRTLDVLHSRGFSIRDLKLHRAPKTKGTPQGLTNTVKKGAQQVAGALGGIGG
jgi:hypothetical protein